MAVCTMLLVLTAIAVCIISAFHPGPSFYTQVVKHEDIEQKTNQLENRTDSVERTMSTIITAMTEMKSNIKSLQVQCTKEELVEKDVKRPRTEEQINSKELEHKIANLHKLVSKNDRKIQVLESQCKVSSKTTIQKAPSSHAENTKSIPLSGGLQSNKNVQKLPGQVQVSSKITIQKAPSSHAETTMDIRFTNSDSNVMICSGMMSIFERGSICSSHEGYVQVSIKLCLKFSVRDPKSWDDSRKSCKRDGADLLTFYERKEQKDVITFMEAKDVGKLFWIGVKRGRKHFTTISDSIFVGIWSPNNLSSVTSFKCVSLNKSGIGNKYCGFKYGYICQIRLSTTGYGASV